MTKKQLFSIAILSICIFSLFYYFYAGSENIGSSARPPATVDILRVEKKPVQFYNDLPGRISAFQEAEIRPQVTGLIIERLFKEGSHVKEGDQLYQIDPALYEAEYASSKANSLKAQASYNTVKTKAERFKELLKRKSVSDQDYEDTLLELEQAKAEIAIAEALVKKAKINLDYTKVYAPISGEIGISTMTKGALVTTNQVEPLTTITRLDPIYLDMSESSDKFMSLRSKISSTAPAKVTLFLSKQNALYKEEGQLQFSDVLVDKTTDSISLRAIFPNPNGTLLPGLFVRARIHLAIEDKILIPQSAVIRGPKGKTSVWKLNKDNTVALVDVTVGHNHENQWEIINGLAPGDQILLNGFQKIYPGASVNPKFTEQAE
tara:strand:- start:49308 stop:50438 length:1131 start_codon:yes stop_codon:yes gene_type:complete